MELELAPLILAALVAVLGLALAADAWLPDSPPRVAERRRVARTDRHRAGEAAIALGCLCAAAALAGRDTWRYGTLAVVAAALCLTAGVLLNTRYLRERLTHRGALRRGRAGDDRRSVGGSVPPDAPERRPHDRRHADRRHTSEPTPPAERR